MKFKKFVVLVLVVISLALIGLNAAPQTLANSIQENHVSVQAPQEPAAAMTWILKNDFRVSPNQANPNPDSFGNADTWSFMKGTTPHNPATYSLVTQFYPDIRKNPGQQGWVGPEPHDNDPQTGLPAYVMNTTGVPLLIDPPAITPPGVFLTHPSSSKPAIVRWHSPFTGALAIAGGVTDVNGDCGDGIQWFIDKNSTTLASGSYPDGGHQLFKDGTNGNQLGNIPVNKGDSIYFLVAPGGNYFCDATQLDVTITMVSVSKPPAPSLVSPANNSTPPRAGVLLDWSDVAFATTYAVVIQNSSQDIVAALTIFSESKVRVTLPPHQTYSWYVQACNSGGCSNKSATWKFKN